MSNDSDRILMRHRVCNVPVEHPFLSVGFLVDPVVREQHDYARDPERYAGRDDGVFLVDGERTLVGIEMLVRQMLVGGVPTGEYRQERYEDGRYPDRRQHDHGPGLGHDQRIVEWLHNRVIPIDADAAQVQYGHCGEVHVHRVPDVAHEPSEHPAVCDLKAGVEAHGEYGDQHVGQGQ